MTFPRSEATAYVVNYVVLLLLLALTVIASSIDLGVWNLAVTFLIATIKAACIVFVFMHLRSGPPLLKLVVVVALLLLWIMLSLSLSDYWTRDWDT